MQNETVVFCDFDGTITEKDIVSSICRKFCPPGVADEVIRQIRAKEISVKQGVIDMVAMIPSTQRQAVLDYGFEVFKLRSGFEDFLNYCHAKDWLFVICSGGFDFFIEASMKPYQSLIARSVAIPVDFSGPHIQLRHNYACENCGTCKLKIMEEYPNATRILIGDGITDLHGAVAAHTIYARSGLCTYLDEEKIPYHRFETFHDILEHLPK